MHSYAHTTWSFSVLFLLLHGSRSKQSPTASKEHSYPKASLSSITILLYS